MTGDQQLLGGSTPALALRVRVDPAGGAWFESFNPYTGKPWARIPRGTAADVEIPLLEAAEVALLPAVRAAPASAEIAAAGTSCRQQIRTVTGRNARHPAQILADAFDPDPAPDHPA